MKATMIVITTWPGTDRGVRDREDGGGGGVWAEAVSCVPGPPSPHPKLPPSEQGQLETQRTEGEEPPVAPDPPWSRCKKS